MSIDATATVLGRTIATGQTYVVRQAPCGAWRICYRTNTATGLNFTDAALFTSFHGAEPDAVRVDAICRGILGRCAKWQQTLMEDQPKEMA